MANSIEIIGDIESTGLSTDYDNILEFSYIKTNPQCEILGAGTLYFWRPDWTIHANAYKIHGLTKEYMEQFIDQFDENLAKLYTIMFNSVFIGKNSKTFDNRMLESFISRYIPEGMMECRIMKFLDIQDYTAPLYKKWYYDTYKKDTAKLGTLTDVCEMLGMTPAMIDKAVKDIMGADYGRTGFHSAMFDSVATFFIAQWLVETGRINLEY